MNLDEEQLMEIAKCRQRARLIAWLKKNRIKFKYTADDKRIWTTQNQVEKAFDTNLEVIRIGQEKEKSLSKAS